MQRSREGSVYTAMERVGVSVFILKCVSFVSVADESNVGSLVGNTAGEANRQPTPAHDLCHRHRETLKHARKLLPNSQKTCYPKKARNSKG